jgi:hypothetical protein
MLLKQAVLIFFRAIKNDVNKKISNDLLSFFFQTIARLFAFISTLTNMSQVL